MNHEGESMDCINQGNLFKILKASQIRRNDNAEGNRKREDARNKYVRYFSRIFAVSSGGITSEQKP